MHRLAPFMLLASLAITGAACAADLAPDTADVQHVMDACHEAVVTHDGAIASVYFDFIFHLNGRAHDTGSDAWQLAKGSTGRRIAAIACSSHGAPT